MAHARRGHFRRSAAGALSWVHETYVSSDSEPGKEHEVERNADGALRCGCMSFRFAKGEIGSPTKTCRHLRALAQAGTDVREATTPKGETFRFRRAISFGPLGSRK